MQTSTLIILATVAARTLRHAGYAVFEARDGVATLDLASAHHGPIHILVSDIVMPRLGGRELAQRLTAMRPSVKVLFISGYAAEAMGPEGVLEDGVRLLRKPFAPAALLARVCALIDASLA